jgi:hypothetical protein
MEVLDMPETSNQEHIVAIFKGELGCCIAPEELLACRGDSVTFQNLTDSVVVLFFPDQSLFGQISVEVGPGQSITLNVQSVDFGGYPYTAYCKGTGQFADKASRPKIIIIDTPSKMA